MFLVSCIFFNKCVYFPYYSGWILSGQTSCFEKGINGIYKSLGYGTLERNQDISEVWSVSLGEGKTHLAQLRKRGRAGEGGCGLDVLGLGC